jgi:hypothetical protein
MRRTMTSYLGTQFMHSSGGALTRRIPSFATQIPVHCNHGAVLLQVRWEFLMSYRRRTGMLQEMFGVIYIGWPSPPSIGADLALSLYKGKESSGGYNLVRNYSAMSCSPMTRLAVHVYPKVSSRLEE